MLNQNEYEKLYDKFEEVQLNVLNNFLPRNYKGWKRSLNEFRDLLKTMSELKSDKKEAGQGE